MEREDDVQLIHAVLSGDDSAFDILVLEKLPEESGTGVHSYRRSVWFLSAVRGQEGRKPQTRLRHNEQKMG